MGRKTLSAIPRNVWLVSIALGLSYASSIMAESALPFYICSLGASTTILGLIEGLALFATFASKLSAGFISDKVGSRRSVALFGIVISTLMRPVYALTGVLNVVLFAKLFDRVNQGVFKAPTDALIGDLTPKNLRGASYGLRESLSRVGSLIGSLGATAILLWTANNYHAVFWIAAIPGVISALIIAFFIKEQRKTADEKKAHKVNFNLETLKKFPKSFWNIIFITVIIKMAHFGDGLLLIKAKESGLPIAYAPLMIVLMYAVSSLISYPTGWLYDRMDHTRLFLMGLVVLGIAHFFFSLSNSLSEAIIGVVCWGIYQGIIQTVQASMISEVSPEHLRGTGFGIFHLALGTGILIGNTSAGFIWDKMGSSSAFFAAAVLVFVTTFILFMQSLFVKKNLDSKRH